MEYQLTEKVKMVALSSNYNNRLQNFDGILSYLYGNTLEKCTQKNCYNVYKLKYKMISFDDVTVKNKIKCNPNWPHIRIIRAEY